MADGETYEQALDLCLDDMQHGSALPLNDDVREFVRIQGVPKFRANHSAWTKNRAKVRRAMGNRVIRCGPVMRVSPSISGTACARKRSSRRWMSSMRVSRETSERQSSAPGAAPGTGARGRSSSR